MTETIRSVADIIRNKVLNYMGVERDLAELLADKDIGRVMAMLQNRDDEVNAALNEFTPELHKVMKRADKVRDGKDPYRVEKLPRSRQRYINEVELFFLFGKPVEWNDITPNGGGDAYDEFMKELKYLRFNSLMRQLKRVAGSETEAALLFHFYNDEDKPQVRPLVLSYSEGYKLRPLIDQYGNMLAFGYGYSLREGKKTVEHFDVQTADYLYYCKKGNVGWEVEVKDNPTGRINVVYVRQKKAWDGAQLRIEREEKIDSNMADTNNYFASPMAKATADVIDGLGDPERPGKMIQLMGDDSQFEYINPPIASELLAQERAALRESILFDTFTPDLSFEALKGMGTMSGEAIERAMTIGLLKASNLQEIYSVVVDRTKNIILAIMKNLTHVSMAIQLDSLIVEHEFVSPFGKDIMAKWQAIGQAYNNGVLSLEEAVRQIGIADNPDEEIERIKKAEMQKQTMSIFEPTY